MSSPKNVPASSTLAFDPRWKSLLECAATEVFSMMAGVELAQYPEAPLEPRGEQTAMVGLAGALCGMITIRCSSKAAEKLSAAMLGGDVSSNISAMADALGELCNMVAGNFKSKVSTLADHCMLSVPTVISGEDYVMQTALPSSGLNVLLTFEGEPIWFSLVIHA